MSTLTTLLGLIKADGGEFQDVDIINQNWDKIDAYLRASVKFVPLPLGSNTSDAANYNNPFGFQPAYADMGDNYLLRGVIGKTATAVSLATDNIIGRLPGAIGAIQYFNAEGSGTAVVPLQFNVNGQIAVKTTPTNASYWASLDGIRVWK